MTLDSIPLFAALKSRLGYIDQREKLIAQNVANADTPGYTPQDLKPFTLPGHGGPAGSIGLVQPEKTNPAHLSGDAAAAGIAGGRWRAVATPDSEATLDGNKVVLEDQMAKMTDARVNYEAVIGFYQKSLDMIRLATSKPGGG